MDVIGFEPSGGAAAAEDREVMLAPVAGPDEDHPAFSLTEPPHRVPRMTAMDDASDEPDDRCQHDDGEESSDPPRRVRDCGPEAMRDIAEQGFRGSFRIEGVVSGASVAG